MGINSTKLDQRIKNYKRTYKDFTDIMDTFGWAEKTLMKERFETWKISALHKLLTDFPDNNDLGYYAHEIIAQFNEREAYLEKNKDACSESIEYMYYATGDSKYLDWLAIKDLSSIDIV